MQNNSTAAAENIHNFIPYNKVHSEKKPSTLGFFKAQMVTKLRQVRNGLVFSFQERFVLKPVFLI